MFCVLKLLFISSVFILIPIPAKAEFIPLKEDEIKSCSLKLSQAKNIPHQCQIIKDRNNSLEVWQERISFNFGRISQEDFNYLKNTYGRWSKSKSAVTYDRNRTYQLIDFLPPLIQALNSHRFIPESTAIKDGEGDLKQLKLENKKQLYMNCWGLVYEILRTAQDSQAKPTVFMAQGSLILKQLRQNSRSLLKFNEPEDVIPKSITQPGDIILIMHISSTGREYLDHVAIAIDDGIYFEKAGTGANVPIRIIDEATLRKIWQPGVFNYEVRRLKQDAVLPHPQEIFSLNALPIQKEFPLSNKISPTISKNTTIMWEEEEKNLATTSLFHIINTLPMSKDITGRANLSTKSYQSFLYSHFHD